MKYRERLALGERINRCGIEMPLVPSVNATVCPALYPKRAPVAANALVVARNAALRAFLWAIGRHCFVRSSVLKTNERQPSASPKRVSLALSALRNNSGSSRSVARTCSVAVSRPWMN